MQKGPEYLANKNIIELGSGTGLVGLAIGAFPSSHTWITDQASVGFHFTLLVCSPC